MRQAGRLTGAPERGAGTVLALGLAASLLILLTFALIAGAALAASNRARSAADLAALAGAGELLPRFRGIQLELPLRQLYADQMLWLPMIEWMAERGFSVAMAKENGFDWDAMRLLELDVLFWRGG